MVALKPMIVIIGAGISGLTAANKLHIVNKVHNVFDLIVVEGSNRIGGRIYTSELNGDRIELGATWIHGISGSPVYKIAKEIGSLESDQPWERMDGFPQGPVTVTEKGIQIQSKEVQRIFVLYKKLMEFASGKLVNGEDQSNSFYHKIAERARDLCARSNEKSLGSFLRNGLRLYLDVSTDKWIQNHCNSSKTSLEEAIFTMFERLERTNTSADSLLDLDFKAESEYMDFPDEQITIAKGYSSIIESLSSVLPSGTIQLGKMLKKIEWKPDGFQSIDREISSPRPVKLYFQDGSSISADHVIITVSLGVLKKEIEEDSSMFNPILPSFKTDAISRLGFGVVNKLFLQIDHNHDKKHEEGENFPFLQMVFDRDSKPSSLSQIPWWMRNTNSLCPIYKESNVVLAWYAGKEALHIESMEEKKIVNGVSATISCFSDAFKVGSTQKISRILKTQWGTDPLFLGSYSYVAVGSSGEDFDSMAEPLPKAPPNVPPLQLLFAGEATHRTHYSTTHGAYFSGLREANRILKHYNCGVS